MKTFVVVNPSAGSGRAKAAGYDLAARLGNAEVLETKAPGHAVDLVRPLLAEDVTVVAVGGDGTAQEVTTGLCLGSAGEHVTPKARLCLLPVGTGGDYRRSVGQDASIPRAVERITSGRTRKVDVGSVRFTRPDGEEGASAFLNVASFGIGGLTDRIVSTSSKWLGGRVAFFTSAVRATLVYERSPVELILDGERQLVLPANVALCIGRYFGGGMLVAPEASLDDGYFDVICMQGTKLDTLLLSRDIYRGTHLVRDGVSAFRARTVEARPTRGAEVLVDVDGEQPGRLPLRAEVRPRLLELLVDPD